MADLLHRRNRSKFLLTSASSTCDVAEMLRQTRLEPTSRIAKSHKFSRHHQGLHKMEILFVRPIPHGPRVRAARPGYPVIAKPIVSSGPSGVLRITPPSFVSWRYACS